MLPGAEDGDEGGMGVGAEGTVCAEIEPGVESNVCLFISTASRSRRHRQSSAVPTLAYDYSDCRGPQIYLFILGS